MSLQHKVLELFKQNSPTYGGRLADKSQGAASASEQPQVRSALTAPAVLEAENAALRERITELEQIGGWDEWACKQNQNLFRDAAAERDRLQARIDRALALHQPSNEDSTGYCVGCWEGGGQDGAVSWDYCPTIAALAADTPTTATAEGSEDA